MKFGIKLWNQGPLSSPEGITRMVQRAYALGVDAVDITMPPSTEHTTRIEASLDPMASRVGVTSCGRPFGNRAAGK